MNKKIIFLVAIIAVLVIALQKVSSKKTIMVGTSSWPGWDLFEHAQKKGDPLANYNLKFTRFNEYNDILNAFINNTIDMATVTLHEALVIQSKIKDPVRIILLLDYTIGSDAILAHSTTEFLHQLKGKTVGTEKNTVAYYTLLRGLEKANLSKEDIIIKDLSLDELLTQFKQKKLDAISLYDPYLFELTSFTKNVSTLFSSKEIPREICDVVIVRQSLLQHHPTIVSNVRKNWFNITSKALPFKKLTDPIYTDKRYITHVRRNIYFANQNENNYAFGTPQEPGYLKSSIARIQQFLAEESDIRLNPSMVDNMVVY